MQEYTIQRSSRKCHKTNRSFEPNERYYSLVLQKGSELVRQDWGQDYWQGPPKNAVCWWINRMPAKKAGKLTPAPSYALLDALEKLCEQPDDGELAYLLAILLMRQRILVEQSDEIPAGEASPMQLIHNSDGREFVVPIHQPDANRAELLHQKLVELLYCDT
jgi:hypothetical protein